MAQAFILACNHPGLPDDLYFLVLKIRRATRIVTLFGLEYACKVFKRGSLVLIHEHLHIDLIMLKRAAKGFPKVDLGVGSRSARDVDASVESTELPVLCILQVFPSDHTVVKRSLESAWLVH